MLSILYVAYNTAVRALQHRALVIDPPMDNHAQAIVVFRPEELIDPDEGLNREQYIANYIAHDDQMDASDWETDNDEDEGSDSDSTNSSGGFPSRRTLRRQERELIKRHKDMARQLAMPLCGWPVGCPWCYYIQSDNNHLSDIGVMKPIYRVIRKGKYGVNLYAHQYHDECLRIANYFLHKIQPERRNRTGIYPTIRAINNKYKKVYYTISTEVFANMVQARQDLTLPGIRSTVHYRTLTIIQNRHRQLFNIGTVYNFTHDGITYATTMLYLPKTSDDKARVIKMSPHY